MACVIEPPQTIRLAPHTNASGIAQAANNRHHKHTVIEHCAGSAVSLKHICTETLYASPAWREGLRKAIVSRIVADAHVLMGLDKDGLAALRHQHG